ncbi:phospholipase D-like domain-containing protein [Cocleimonas sp. KMM 6892]|uniref:phospholipase D-like domain-containing protein n=1 Tax=unclassified Cocleimonas TaxID=2639732 RepID=UPI002DB9C061|nr:MULTISPECIES: phospholipase D-like domain-containing protein [unclassified Cocleimonas]MEB8434038.1 phospholipase D-like domain-containing protein [Cocleimonas sp. KMM 6892]MEC4716849.1 phospholipase D-like domain-containing protein [Cocleimonas sp. KMM 6895]MEC4745996.1 phospholipase D-like domain-containing protein [Cocleimonas sp. KMM 6896]
MSTNEKIILNPITNLITEKIENSSNRLLIAVPFISSYARKVLEQEKINNIKDKRLITKFDDSNINTFDIPTLQYLLDNGFEICFNNDIHLKHYIIDNRAFITSSNLTKGGFEKNIELTVEIDKTNLLKSTEVFDDLWETSKPNVITKELLDENIEKYNVLKKKQKFENSTKVEVSDENQTSTLNVDKLFDEIFNSTIISNSKLQLIYKANKKRNIFKRSLSVNKFDISLFYAPKGNDKRRENLFYDFVYLEEEKLANTGLRESQFEDVFKHPDFHKVISFIFPDMHEMEPWNFEDENSFQIFCKGLFDFEIPQYSEALPIRLASYFYPDKFFPIFKLKDLNIICNELGIDTNAKSRGEKLFAYTDFLTKKLRDIPTNNYIKSNMAYHFLYSKKLYNRLEKGESFQEIKDSYKQVWKKGFIDKGMKSLKSINALNILEI